jgi:hypothetical protein
MPHQQTLLQHAKLAIRRIVVRINSLESSLLLLNQITELLYCSQASKLSISGPLLHVVQTHLHVPYWQAYFLLGGTICFQVRRFWQVGTTMRNEQLHFLELVLFQRFNSCWLCASYLPHRSQLNTAFLLPFLLYFLNLPGRRCQLSPHHVACLEHAVGILNCFVLLIFGIRKGLADDGLGSRVRDLLVGWWCGRIGSYSQDMGCNKDDQGCIGAYRKVQECWRDIPFWSAEETQQREARDQGRAVLTTFDVGNGLLWFW